MRIKTWRSGAQHVLHDADALPQPAPEHFDPAHWRARQLLVGSAPGRAAVAFVRDGLEGQAWALRHYRRGGLMRFVSADLYLWTGLEQTRPFREFRLTAALYDRGLPVPRPVAARVVRAGLLYRGDLVTLCIEDATPLADVLGARELPAGEWHGIGALVRRFQRAGVRHDDINARNLLRGADGGYYLIDFDKAGILPPGPWQEQNLLRLRRSLQKFKAQSPRFRFGDQEWGALLEGYRAEG